MQSHGSKNYRHPVRFQRMTVIPFGLLCFDSSISVLLILYCDFCKLWENTRVKLGLRKAELARKAGLICQDDNSFVFNH